MKNSILSAAALCVAGFGAVPGPLATPALAQTTQSSDAQPAEIMMQADMVVSTIDIRHLRALAAAFNLEIVSEELKPNAVVLAVREPDKPILNIVASACESPDKLSECQGFFVRILLEPGTEPFDAALAQKVNQEVYTLKTVIIEDGRLQIDRLVILSGGVTMGNLAQNMNIAYQDFAAAFQIVEAEHPPQGQ